MFKSRKVKAYLQNVSWKGKEDAPLNQFTIYITPISFVLAKEISLDIATTLFSESIDDRQNPRSVLTNSRLKLPKLEMQSVVFHPTADEAMDGHGVLTKGWSIKSIWSMHLFADSDDITLAFLMEAPLDKLNIELAHKYFKRVVHLSMEDMQTDLFKKPKAKKGADVDEAAPKIYKCLVCGEPTAEWIDGNQDFFCGTHVHGAVGETHKINSKHLSTEAKAAIAAAAKAAPGVDKAADKETTAKDDDKDASHANKKKSYRKGKGKK